MSTQATSAAGEAGQGRQLPRIGPGRLVVWYGVYAIAWLYFVLAHGLRCWGRRRPPAQGGMLIIANHQSFYDPLMVGLAVLRRPFFSLARANLFSHPVLRSLIGAINALPLERGESDAAAMRLSVDLLRRGDGLLIFPEGTRTRDGKTGEFARGMMLLLKRARPTVLPVAIDGAFEVWPRTRKLPRPGGRIGLMVGEPIPAERLLAMNPDDAVALLRDTIEQMRQTMAEQRQRNAPGPQSREPAQPLTL